MPPGTEFCSNCGTQLRDSAFSSAPTDPEKTLGQTTNPGSGHFHTLAETFNPSVLPTSLNSPSPK